MFKTVSDYCARDFTQWKHKKFGLFLLKVVRISLNLCARRRGSRDWNGVSCVNREGIEEMKGD